MASFWKVNQTSTSGSVRVWDLIETLMAAGWTQVSAGGATYPLPLTSAAELNVNNAWIRMQAPDGVREFVIQRGTSDVVWAITYSRAAKFIGGSPSATVAPTATDQQSVLTTGASNFLSTTNARHHVWASDVAPYPFYLVGYPVGGGVYMFIVMLEETYGPVPGLDPDPVVWIRGGGISPTTLYGLGAAAPGAASSSNLSSFGYTSASVGLNIFSLMGSQGVGFKGFSSQEIPPFFDAKDMLSPGLVLRKTVDGNEATKGFTKNFLYAGTVRASGDTYTAAAARDKIYILTSLTAGAFVLPFNGDVPLV